MSDNLITKSFIGEWKDLNGTVITITPRRSKDGYFEITYSNGRGPFVGSSFTAIIPPILTVDFTDDGGNKSGQVTSDWSKIIWDNKTEWTNLNLEE